MIILRRSVLAFSIALFIFVLGFSASDAFAVSPGAPGIPARALSFLNQATIPGAPRNLQASAGNTQNFLGWQAPSSNGGAAITSYRVFRSTNGSGSAIITSGGCANLGVTLACTDTGLNNGQAYTYFVSAVNSVGQGAGSNSVTSTPVGATIPGAPQNLQASAGNTQNFLGWQAPSSNGGAAITSYRVFRSTNGSGSAIITSGGCANLGVTLACTDTGLNNGQAYTYFVSAVNSVGQGAGSNSVTSTPVGATIPGAPQNLQASAGNTQNFLGWQAPSSNGGAAITSYRVFRSTNGSGSAIITSGGCANLGVTLACTDTGLNNGQAYTYFVSAVNSVGQGAGSNSVTSTPVGATIPGAPQNLQASAGNTQNFLGWQAPSSNGGAAITSYRVFRSTNGSGSAIITSGGCANLGVTLACTDTGLNNGQAYTYFVSAVNSVGQGAGSNSVTSTPVGGATIPGAPQNLQASAGNTQNFLGWQAPSSNGGAAITSYRVFRSTNGSGSAIITSGGCANLGVTLACTDTGLNNGQAYTYFVSAVNSVGQGAGSNSVTSTPVGGATIPGAPQNLQASAGNTQNFLGWQAPSSNGGAAITSYRVFRSTNGSGSAIITSGGCANLGVTLACTDTGLNNGQAYTYFVSAVNSVGQGAGSNSVTSTPVGATIPGAPQNLQASAGNTQNFLGWQAPSSNGGAAITSYRVFRSTNGSGSAIITSGGCTNLGVTLACTDTGLNNGQAYNYFVSAVNSVGQGAGSNSVTSTPSQAGARDFTVSASPSSRTITQGQTTTYGVTVISQNGFSGQVQLFALNLPGNVVLAGTSFIPQTVTVPSGGSATSTFNYVSNNTVPTGTFTVTMQGQGGVIGSTAVALIVNPALPDAASFVRETIPDDGPSMSPGQTFTKTWTIRNTGATTWTSGYKLHWVGGDRLSNHADVAIVGSVSPNTNYTFSIPMTAPSNPGSYRENWSFVNPSGTTINVGGSPVIWVSIRVGTSCSPPIITTNPAAGSVESGMSITLRVYANGQGVTYQWYQGAKGDTSRPIVGATSSAFTTPRLFSMSSYWVRVASGCGTSVDSETATITIARTIDVIDPACESETRCQGTNLNGSGLTGDINLLASASVSRFGIVADGVTKLLLKVRSNGPVRFVLDSGAGTLMTRHGTSAGNIVMVDPETVQGEKIAFAIYQAPIDFVGAQSPAEIRIRVQIGSEPPITKTLSLYRPPVLLVHGVWSDPTAWQGFVPRLAESGFHVCPGCLVDYSYDSAGSFDPLQPGTPINAMLLTTRLALFDYRKRDIAITQVDVVGHSMGGLVARASASAALGSFLRADNYREGDFHKLITIGTPHLGTRLADFLISNRFNPFIIAFFNSLTERPLGPAVEGFQTSSTALRNLGQTNVPTHAIVGTKPTVSITENRLNLLISLVDSLGLYGSLDSILNEGRNNDTIVPAQSQRGGLSGVATGNPITDVVHADLSSGVDVGETSSTAVWNEIISLLKAPVGSSSFGHPPTPQVMPSESVEPAAFRETGSSVGIMASTSLTPTPGTSFHPGEIANISFAVTDANSVKGALLFIGDAIEDLKGPGPFSFAYTVPSGRGGKIPISAISYGDSSESHSASTYIVVSLASAPASVAVSPSNVLIEQIGQRFQIRVTGSLADGSQIDLTPGTAGTSYSAQSGTDKVAAISPDGLVETRGVGEDTILVTYSGVTYAVNLTVGDSTKPRITGASVTGKKLFVTGENFDDGAKILLDGELQKKTANDEGNPTTILIGNKAGKLIARGQTVVLMVKNSDGSLSNAFSFTRPQ